MNSRTLILVAAVGLLGVGLMLTLADLFSPKAPEPSVAIAVASRPIEPYQIITEDMIASGGQMSAREARDRALYPAESVVGHMSTNRIPQGEAFSAANALPPENVRFTEDLNLEIVSFQASVDRLVGGELRPGHVINLYGTGRDEEGQEFSVLVADRLWVVRVTAGGGPVTQATAVPDLGDGTIAYEGDLGRNRPGTLVTVAVPPATAAAIIDAIGARGLAPYVTLAASQSASNAFATSVPQPTAGLPPDLALTATALYNALRSTPVPVPARTGGGASR